MVTLDIEDTCIRIAVVKGKLVKLAVSSPLEPGMVEDGVVKDTAAVSQQIKELMAAHKIDERQVTVSASGLHSIYRTISLPRLPGKMMAEAAKREMARVMPVSLTDLYTSWQAIDVSDTETVFCLIGLPRSTVDAMMETLHQAGLDSKALDIRPLAIARVANEKDAIIINVQPSGFDIVVMIDGIPELLRSLAFPSGDISATDKVELVKEELDRTVAFYNSSPKGDPLADNTVVFISGEMRETLAESLGYQVKPLPELLSGFEGFDASEYVTNIGLALKQVKDNKSQVRININVMPEAYLPKPFPVIEIASWAFFVVAIAALVPMAMWTYQSINETSALQARVHDIRHQVDIKQGTKVDIDKLQVNIDEVKAAQDVLKQSLNSFKTQRAKVNGDLSKITSLLPGTIDLTSISYGSSSRISGTAPDEVTILGYIRDLRDTGRFSQVIISDMHELEYNKWNFTLTLE